MSHDPQSVPDSPAPDSPAPTPEPPAQDPAATVTAAASADLGQQRWRNTLLLAAATHHAPELSDPIIDSYLRSRQQALPPEPGLHAEPVLRHALLARHRRGIRDLLLLGAVAACTALLIFIDPGFVAFWLYLALIVAIVRALRHFSRRRGDSRGGGLGVLGSAGLFVVLLLLGNWLLSAALGPLVAIAEISFLPRSALSTAVLILGVAVVFAVFLADTVTVRQLLAAATWKPTGASGPTTSPLASLVEKVATRPYRGLLHEVANRPEAGNVLVHSGWNAFPGYGDRVNQWSMALPLYRDDQVEGDAGGHEVEPHQIYRAVAEELRLMQSSDLLAPGARLQGLSVSPALVANSDGLAMNSETPLGRVLLPDPSGRATTAISADAAEQLADHGLEWARYFQRCQVEGWESNLVVSTWLHVGCDERTLYLEWNAYTLFPIAAEYRIHDTFGASRGHSALAALRALPGVFSRFPERIRSAGWTLRRLFAPATSATSARLPDYGSTRSIREIAANTECGNEFQEMDALRYIRLLERRTLSAVHRHLRDRGFSTQELESRRNAVINTTVINGGNFTGAHTFGPSSSAVAHSVTNGGARNEEATAR